MELIPLPVIGWLYSVASAAAILLGAWIVIGVHLRDEAAHKHLAARVLDDSLLFGIWIMGLAGGAGVLLEKGWSRPVLELFCWALAVLLVLVCWQRLRAAPPPRATLGLSLALFLVPVIALCAATILTLRSETALRVLSG